MKIHINSVHNGLKNHKCHACRTRKLVHYDQKDHKYERPFSEAGKFKILHIDSLHNGQKDHECDSCGKSFSRAGHLQTHINAVHNGQKDHKSDSCG